MAEGNIWEIIPRLVQRVYSDLEPEMRKTEPTVYADFQVTDIFRFSQPQSSVCCSLFGSFAKIWVQWLLKQMVRKKYEALMNMTALCSFVSEEHTGCVNGMIMVEQEQCLDLLWRIYRTSFRFTSFSAFGFYSLARWGGGGKKKIPHRQPDRPHRRSLCALSQIFIFGHGRLAAWSDGRLVGVDVNAEHFNTKDFTQKKNPNPSFFYPHLKKNYFPPLCNWSNTCCVILSTPAVHTFTHATHTHTLPKPSLDSTSNEDVVNLPKRAEAFSMG